MGNPIEDQVSQALGALEALPETEGHSVDYFGADVHGKPGEEQTAREETMPAALMKAQTAFIEAQMIFLHDHDLKNLVKRQLKYIEAQRACILMLDGEADVASINEQTIISQTERLKKLGVI